MILLYALVILVLSAGAVVASLRVRRMESKFVRAAGAADALVKEQSFRGGNCALPDPLKAARRQFELGRLVQVRDRLEQSYDAWENRADRLRRLKGKLLSYNGRVLPYLFGVLDLLGVFAILTLTNVISPEMLRVALQSAHMLISR